MMRFQTLVPAAVVSLAAVVALIAAFLGFSGLMQTI